MNHPQFTYESFHIHYIISLLSRENMNSQLTSLPMCGFIAQLVEHRTGIAEVTGSNPVEALIFFRLLYSNCLNWKFTAKITYHPHIYPQFTYESFHIHYMIETKLHDKAQRTILLFWSLKEVKGGRNTFLHLVTGLAAGYWINGVSTALYIFVQFNLYIQFIDIKNYFH